MINNQLDISRQGINTFAQLTTAGSKNYSGIACSSTGQYVYASALTNFCSRSLDYGATWANTGTSASWRSVCCSSTGQYVFICGSLGIYKSSDYGANFSQVSTNLSLSIACSSTGQYVYAGGSNEIYKSSDYGATFTLAYTDGNAIFWGIACSSDGSKIMASRYSQGFCFSRNSGSTWKNNNVSGMLTDTFYICCSSDGEKVMLGSSNTTYKSQICCYDPSNDVYFYYATCPTAGLGIKCSYDGGKILFNNYEGIINYSFMYSYISGYTVAGTLFKQIATSPSFSRFAVTPNFEYVFAKGSDNYLYRSQDVLIIKDFSQEFKLNPSNQI